MPSMVHVGISLLHPLTFSSAGLANSQTGVGPTVHLLGFCTWTAKRGWRKSTDHVAPHKWQIYAGKHRKALLLPDSPSAPC